MSPVLRIFDRCFNSAMTTVISPCGRSAPGRSCSACCSAPTRAELSAAATGARGRASSRVAETTLRAALSRMVAAGDLVRDGSTYRLSERLLERQRRQDAALDPATTAWDGAWEQVVITSSGRERRGPRRTARHADRPAARRAARGRLAAPRQPGPAAALVARRPDRHVQGDTRRGAPSLCLAGSGTSTGGPPTGGRCSPGSRAPTAPETDSRSAPPSYDTFCGTPPCPRS